MTRPSFYRAWHAFMEVNIPVKEVGKKLGGRVQANVDMPQGGFENACPIRMSYVLNQIGMPIHKNLKYKTVSGEDGNQYLFRINDILEYLEKVFGKPDKKVNAPKPSDFTNMKGIIVVKGHGWGNAKGHVTLWNGMTCSDTCHLTDDPENGTFIPENASIWVLP